ncbi:hypothetical protein D3C87_1960700 [compost metagenome]
MLPFRVLNAAVDHAFQRFLRLSDFAIDVLHGFGGIVEHTDFHESNGLTRFVTGAQNQGVTRVELHHLLTLKVINAL